MARERAQEKIASGSEEFKRFEEEAIQRQRERVLTELKEKLEEMDRKAWGELLGSSRYIDKGYVRRKVETSVGRVWVRVKRLKRKVREGSVYGLFDVCGVGRVSQRAEEHCVQVAVGQPYERSREILQRLCGMEMSRMGIWKVTQRKGKQERERVEEQRRKIFEHGEIPLSQKPTKKAAIVEIDGVLVATREVTEVEEVRGKRRMEVKVGVAFTATEQISKNRRRTIERKLYGEIGSAEEFGERWYGECLRHGIEPETRLQVIGDGAAWIRTVQRKMFPGSRYTLDLYHLQHAAGEVLTQRQYRHFCSLVWATQPEETLRYLRRLTPSDVEHKQELDDFCSYIERNIDGMHYDRSGPVGSGVVEKAADIVVARRMKRRGMTWSREGANNLLALRLRALNDSYDRRWHTP
jgi:hypothetical protein